LDIWQEYLKQKIINNKKFKIKTGLKQFKGNLKKLEWNGQEELLGEDEKCMSKQTL
jgi:hypothetical protein